MSLADVFHVREAAGNWGDSFGRCMIRKKVSEIEMVGRNVEQASIIR